MSTITTVHMTLRNATIICTCLPVSLPLAEEQRRKILWDNCAQLYDIPAPAAPLTREVNTSSAAE
jgi:hypothetical protein